MTIKKWLAANTFTRKTLGILFLTLTLLMTIIPGMSSAEVRYQKMGIVTCTNVSIRMEPDTRSARYTRLENGAPVLITGEWDDDWYIVDLAYICQGEGEGYALKEYITTNAYYITLNESTILWADPFGSGVANGEKAKGATMLVLSETKDWFVVQTRESSAGSSFIRKSGLDYVVVGDEFNQNTNQGYSDGFGASTNVSTNVNTNSNLTATPNNNLYVVTATTLAVRSEADDNLEPIGFLHNGDVVNVIKYGDYFTSIEYKWSGQITECWVHTKYLKKIYK